MVVMVIACVCWSERRRSVQAADGLHLGCVAGVCRWRSFAVTWPASPSLSSTHPAWSPLLVSTAAVFDG